MRAVLAAVLLAAAALAAAGCSAPRGVVGYLEAPYRETFRAAERALAPAPIERTDPTAGVIRTGWTEVLSERTRGYILEGHMVVRRRYELRVWPEGARTAVEVTVRAEERAPGGTQAIRWQRSEPPAAVAEDLIERIKKEFRP